MDSSELHKEWRIKSGQHSDRVFLKEACYFVKWGEITFTCRTKLTELVPSVAVNSMLSSTVSEPSWLYLNDKWQTKSRFAWNKQTDDVERANERIWLLSFLPPFLFKTFQTTAAETWQLSGSSITGLFLWTHTDNLILGFSTWCMIMGDILNVGPELTSRSSFKHLIVWSWSFPLILQSLLLSVASLFVYSLN